MGQSKNLFAGITKSQGENSRCWWRNGDRLIKTVLTIAYSTNWVCPDCHGLNFSN